MMEGRAATLGMKEEERIWKEETEGRSGEGERGKGQDMEDIAPLRHTSAVVFLHEGHITNHE